MNHRPRFEELEVWRLAHELTLQVYRLTRNFPAEEKYRLTDQLCRAAASIPANIAESDGRQQPDDQIHFLHIARGSLSEARYFLTLSRDLGFIDAETETRLNETASKLHAKLYAFITSKKR